MTSQTNVLRHVNDSYVKPRGDYYTYLDLVHNLRTKRRKIISASYTNSGRTLMSQGLILHLNSSRLVHLVSRVLPPPPCLVPLIDPFVGVKSSIIYEVGPIFHESINHDSNLIFDSKTHGQDPRKGRQVKGTVFSEPVSHVRTRCLSCP